MSDYADDIYYRVRNKKSEPITFHKKAEVKQGEASLRGRSRIPRLMHGLKHEGEADQPVTGAENPASAPAARTPGEETSRESLASINPEKSIVLTGEQINQIDESLDLMLNAREIGIKNLTISPNTSYCLINETARVISIRSDYNSNEPLVIPPFGQRALNSEILKNYDFADWESLRFISLERAASGEVENVGAYTMTGLLAIAYVLYVLVSIPLALFTKVTNWGTIGLVSLVAMVLIGLSIFTAVRLTNDASTRLNKYWNSAWDWLKMFPGMAMVVMTGIGLPLIVLYQFGGGKDMLAHLAQLSQLSQLTQLSDVSQALQQNLIAKLSQLSTLGRLLQVSFISIASILPALLYYLFGRQQAKNLTESFFRQVMQLDPNVQSRSEARTKYEPLLNSVFDTGNSPLSVLLLVISTGLLVMGWVVTLSPVGIPPQDSKILIDFFTPTSNPFAYGFLGAYYFAINMIFRRYLRADLSPKTYASITVRFLVTLVLVWVVSALPEFTKGSIEEKILLAVVFVIGIFPETGMAIIKDSIKAVLDFFRPPDAQEDFPLTDLEGITVYDRARLLEEGIENIENLAHSNMMEMVASTMLPTQRIIDMFDQAILYLHLNMENRTKSNAGAVLRDRLKGMGIRCATDLLSAMDNARNGGESLGIDHLDIIVSAMQDDEWLEYIKTWRNSSSWKSQIMTNPYEFHKGSVMEELDGMKASVPGDIRGKSELEPRSSMSGPLPEALSGTGG